jgi:hypothetical protein
MASEAEAARQQAARFLVMAMEARDKGNLPLADLLTEAAYRAFDKAEEADVASPPQPTPEQQEPVAQQPQQIQPDKEPDE